jgi:gas vesicle protein
MSEERGGGGVLVAFVLGAIAGAAVALLVAPASGEETRRKLGERAREGRDKASEAARQGRDFLRNQREGLTSAFERGKEAFDQARGPKETA